MKETPFLTPYCLSLRKFVMGDTKRLLIIGNGAAGSQLTAKIAKLTYFKLTVLTPFSYSEVSVNMTKAIAVGSNEYMKCVFPLLREDNVEYIIDECVTLTSTKAILRSTREVMFDVCVIATGQKIPNLLPDVSQPSFNERKMQIEDLCQRVAAAHCVTIGGGGPIGVELAADIKLRNNDKRVVLIHSQQSLLNSMHPPFRELAANHLTHIGVELIMGDRALKHEDGEVHLASGVRIASEVFIPAHPAGGNSGFLPAACVDERGYIKVDDTFSVQLLSNVFAFGDCCDMDAAKTYPKIYDQLATVRHNALAALKGEPLRRHVRGRTMMGRFEGPVMVALGHGLSGEPEEGFGGVVGYGIGPDCPGILGTLCWLGCFLSWPCSYPAGSLVARAKSDLNASIRPRKGKGFSG